ncbi:YcnI family protein [Amycolatopsis sp. GM8]|uniref:YcnI family copper-binding membrane protein n=1 Tax=Amycolatopsis sp. GM8 TaxID=2896530 RepID=UPI001F1E210F|nr:YcnI family protein [Amycolatopsis sp. GM8]
MRAPHAPGTAGRGLSWSRRLAVVVCTGAAAMFTGLPFAVAHVSVTPDTAQAGDPAVLSFRVPNERDDATTVRVEVTFPADQPLESVVPRALPGWKIDVRKQMTAQPAEPGHDNDEMDGGTVSSIVWEGGAIPSGTFEEFPVRIGKIPGSGTLAFVALQTYSDGQTVRWADPVRPGQPEPEHPAPTVTVAPLAAVTPPAESTSDTPARVLAGAGLAAGLGAAAVALVRRRPVRPAPVSEVDQKRETTRL